MSNNISIPPNAGGAFPVNAVTGIPPQGGTATPAYLYATYPTDRDTIAGAPVNIVLITDADLVENGGGYSLAGNPYAIPMFTAPAELGEPSGNAPIPVYVVNP